MTHYLWYLRWLLACLLLTPDSLWARSFQVNYSAEPEAADLLAFECSILQPDAKADLTPGHALGRKYFAYVSLVEVGKHASYAAKLKEAGVPLLAPNPAWNSQCVDLTSPLWEAFVVEQIARPAVTKGFDGFFLDTADSVGLLAEAEPAKAKQHVAAVIALVKKLRSSFPGKEIILNRGFALLAELKGAVDGVLIESVFQTFNAKGEYGPVAAGDHQALVQKIAEIKAGGLRVYVVDYLAPGQGALAVSVVEQLRKLGAEPFLTTKELQGTLLGPITRVARKILVIYGSVLAESEVAEKFAADSFTAERLQMPLEWLGYEVEYVNVGQRSPPAILDDQYAGIIFDVETKLPFGGEAWYVDWILEQQKRGSKILFTGQYPFQQDVQRIRLLQGLKVWGSYAQVPRPEKVELRKVNRDVMNYEATLVPHPAEIEDSRAPEGSQVDVSVSCTDEAANKLIFDAIYSCSWGGALLDPYATFQVSAEDQASLFDPFKFLQRIFPGGRFPAPDPTTRDGQRIFYTHIDGDGFCGVTGHAGNEICGAIVRDRILKKYPFPITVSLVEASMRGWEIGQDDKDVAHYEEVAKACLALPNVQAASHSFSHPYVWIDRDDEYIPLYENRGLELKPLTNYDVEHPVMAREVRGSVEYIQKFCPPDKKVDLMLWSGNCRPSPEALKICREMGIENMNGGNTVISKRHPYLANVSPRVMLWDGELQIHAANQNEFVYTKNWTGPYYGGFAQVLETFAATEEPRRLKPVNIYYHFYSAVTIGSLRALEKIHDWVLSQPLHSLPAVAYARIARDSYGTKIYQSGASAWLLVNQGHQRTFRLDDVQGLPDLAACSGVTGYRKVGSALYVHTKGERVTQVVLAAQPAPRLHLESSQGEISWQELSPRKAQFTVSELRPKHQVVLAGSAPKQSWQLKLNKVSSTVTADADGRIVLDLSGDAAVSLEAK